MILSIFIESRWFKQLILLFFSPRAPRAECVEHGQIFLQAPGRVPRSSKQAYRNVKLKTQPVPEQTAKSKHETVT